MRVLIVGSNARTGSARYAERYVTFAGMLREAHRVSGDEVWIRNWEPGIQHEGWGRIYIGLSSPAYIGSDRIFGALILLSELRDGPDHDPRLRFFIDDPDMRVLRNAITSVHKDPAKILAPFNVKRHHYHLVVDDTKMREKVVRGLKYLDADEMAWPETYIPTYAWGNAARLASPLRPNQRSSVRGIDPTSLVPLQTLTEESATKTVSSSLVPREPFWVAEAPKKDDWIRETHVHAPILSAKTGTDAARLSLYGQALGVLEPQLSTSGAGWWSSRAVMAAAAKTYYATQWRSVQSMTHSLPYTKVLPSAFEELNEAERGVLIEEQRDALFGSVWSVAEVQEALHVIV